MNEFSGQFSDKQDLGRGWGKWEELKGKAKRSKIGVGGDGVGGGGEDGVSDSVKDREGKLIRSISDLELQKNNQVYIYNEEE